MKQRKMNCGSSCKDTKRGRRSSPQIVINIRGVRDCMDLNLRPANECQYDAVSLGEVMLRFDPGDDDVGRHHDGE